MPNLVEIILSVTGADQAAAAVKQVQANLQQLASNMAGQATQAASSLSAAVENQSAIFRDKLSLSLSDTTKQLLAFGAAAVSVHAIYSNLRDAISDGASFVQLSRRTGESVQDLVVLRQAFENAGLGAAYIGTAANLLDRVLSGTTAQGKRTADVFKELGLTMEQMRGLPFEQQLELLATAFAKLPDQSARAGAAMQLFGRYAGGQMLQLLADTDAFQRAQEQAGRLGERMGEDAQSFLEAQQQLSVIKLRIEEMSVAAAEQLLPTLKSIAGVADDMNLSGIGTLLGAVGPTAMGGLVGLFGIDKLDRALLNAADRFGGSMRGELAGLASTYTGFLADFLPYGLAAAVAFEIVKGVLAAWHDYEVQRIVAHQQAVSAYVKPDEQATAALTGPSDAAAEAARIRAKIADLQAQRNKLTAPSDQKTVYHGYGADAASFITPQANTNADDADKLQRINDELAKEQALLAKVTDAHKVAQIAAENQLKATKEALDKLDLPKLQEEHAKLLLENMTPEQKLGALSSQRSGLQAQLSQALPAGLSSDEVQARNLSIENQLLAVDKQIQEAQKQVTAEKAKQTELANQREIYGLETQMEVAKAAGNDELAEKLKEQIELKRAQNSLSGIDLSLAEKRLAAEHQIWEQEQAQEQTKKALTAERENLEGALGKIQEQIAALEADYTRTSNEKWADRKKLIEEEIATLQAQMEADQRSADLARLGGNDETANQYSKAADSEQKELGAKQHELAAMGPSPDDWYGNTIKDLTQLQNSFQTVSQQIASGISSTIGNAFQSIDRNLTDAIVKTGNFKNAMFEVGQSIEQSIIGAIVKMGIQWAENLVIMAAKWVATKLGMAAADKATAAASAAAMVPISTALSEVWASPAALATTASWGGAALAAPGFIAESIGMTQGLASAGFELGGWTGGREGQIAGTVHGEEYVFSAPAVRRVGGPATMEAWHQAALGRGTVSTESQSPRTPPPNVHIYLDKSSYLQAIRGDVSGIAKEVYDRRARGA